MDSIDRAIIDELRRDGRLSNVELAARVNLSASPCLRRVRALEGSGVIRGYHADIEPSAIGRGLEVSVLVELSLKDRQTVEAFEEQIGAIDEVLECRRMFGIPDYIIRVGVADTDDVRAVLHEQARRATGRHPRQLAVHDEAGQGRHAETADARCAGGPTPARLGDLGARQPSPAPL